MSVRNLPTPEERDFVRTASAIRQLAQGRSNATGSVTLTANADTTDVAATYCATGSEVFLTPRTANAAAAIPTTYIASVSNGVFTIAHANNAQSDRTFGYVILG